MARTADRRSVGRGDQAAQRARQSGSGEVRGGASGVLGDDSVGTSARSAGKDRAAAAAVGSGVVVAQYGAPAGAARGDQGGEGGTLNIILVAGANARARTLTLDWRHWSGGGLGAVRAVPRLHVRVQLRHAEMGGGDRSIRGCRRSCSPTSARKTARVQERVQGHSTRWPCAWASCRRRCCASTDLGERLAQDRRAEAAGVAVAAAGHAAGRGGARSSLPSRNLTLLEFTAMLVQASRARSTRAPTSSACSRRCWCTTRPTASSCRRC